MAGVSLKNVTKSFGAVDVLKGIDLEIADREFCVFVGPSGCGKSTLLRLIAGLEEITSGDVMLDGKRVNDVPPDERGLAMVFQTYALYPHMSVRENMGFALKLAGVPRAERDSKVGKAAELLHLTEYLDRKPRQLSGGQRQRVAIGRAIVREPKVFLFDEPLSNLDAALRVQTRIELARLRERLGTTMIYVTHDQVEAMTLADKIVVLRDGLVEQVGSPLDLYHHPRNQFVAGFIGSPKMNFIPVTVVGGSAKGVEVEFTGGARMTVPASPEGMSPGQTLLLGARPESIAISPNGSLDGEVLVVERLGGETYLYVQIKPDVVAIVADDGNSRVKVHERVRLMFDPGASHLFRSDGLAVPLLARHPLAA